MEQCFWQSHSLCGHEAAVLEWPPEHTDLLCDSKITAKRTGYLEKIIKLLTFSHKRVREGHQTFLRQPPLWQGPVLLFPLGEEAE